MQKISSFVTPIVLVVLLGIVVHDKFFANHEPAPIVLTHDPVAVKLGKEYRAAIDKAGVIPLSKVAASTYPDMQALIVDQRASLDAALVSAYTPVATELDKRFGKAEDGKANMADVQSFFRDLAFGYTSK